MTQIILSKRYDQRHSSAHRYHCRTNSRNTQTQEALAHKRIRLVCKKSTRLKSTPNLTLADVNQNSSFCVVIFSGWGPVHAELQLEVKFPTTRILVTNWVLPGVRQFNTASNELRFEEGRKICMLEAYKSFYLLHTNRKENDARKLLLLLSCRTKAISTEPTGSRYLT